MKKESGKMHIRAQNHRCEKLKTGWTSLEGFLSTKLLDNVVFQLRFFLCSLIKAKKSQIKII